MPKRPDIESLRLLSALGIVWFRVSTTSIALAGTWALRRWVPRLVA
jgi:hypothetical protein